jgi:hypothetical protein
MVVLSGPEVSHYANRPRTVSGSSLPASMTSVASGSRQQVHGSSSGGGGGGTGLGRQAQGQGEVAGTSEPDMDRNYASRELFFPLLSILS